MLYLCKVFDFKFNCKIWPNKCGASALILAHYDYPKYEYKTIEQLFQNDINNRKEKVDFVLKYLDEENNE